jgi:DNA invertase Pin-like site-specific DNA recombinase
VAGYSRLTGLDEVGMRALKPGDVVVVVKLDRLARSSRGLHNILHDLQERACGFVSLGESWCGTTTDVGQLVLTIMGSIAEFERKLIHKRCEEGIARARAKGTKFGRKAVLDVSQKRRCGTLRCWRDVGSWRATIAAARRQSGARCRRDVLPVLAARKSLPGTPSYNGPHLEVAVPPP